MTEGSADKALQLSNKVVQGKHSRYVMVCDLFFPCFGKKTLGPLHLYHPRPGFDGAARHEAH